MSTPFQFRTTQCFCPSCVAERNAVSYVRDASLTRALQATFEMVGDAVVLKAAMEEDFTPPDPYRTGIAAMRAASTTPEGVFAAKYATERAAEFAEEDE